MEYLKVQYIEARLSIVRGDSLRLAALHLEGSESTSVTVSRIAQAG